MQHWDLEIIKWLEGFADDISLYYLVMGGALVLDDLVHPYDTCLLRYIHASVYLNERGAFLKMVF
jgi:hypothetical protein